MIRALSIIVAGLPFASAAVLSAVGSWRIATRINAGAATLQFAVACALVWHARDPAARLVLLTAFVAMTTSWSGCYDDALRSLDRRSLRRYHAGYQALIGAIQLALLADSLFVSWLALVAAVAAAAVVTGAAPRLLILCGIGLMLALLGTLLPDPAPGRADIFLLLGYAALAGLPPLHSWLANAAAQAVPPGAIIVTTLLPNVPLLLFVRAGIEPDLLVALGLVSLLLGAIALLAHADMRRTVAFAGMAQLGMIVFAIGIGATLAAWLHMALLALARAAVLETNGNDVASWLTLGLLPLYALYLLAGPTVAIAAWLLLPLAVGVLLTVWPLLERCPTTTVHATPIWLQVAVIVVLAFAPGPLVTWLRAAAAG